MPRPPSRTRQPLDTSSSPGEKVPTDIKLIGALNVIESVLALALVSGISASAHPLAVPLVVLLFVFIVCTYGLLTLRWWGWFGIGCFQVLGGLIALLTVNLIGLIISGVIVYYLAKRVDLYLDEPSSSYA